MCGFVGVFGTEAVADLLVLPAQTIQHRGSDGHQVNESPHFAIISCRQAIAPPISFRGISRSPDGSALAMNGEIFSGVAPQPGQTDTEALHDLLKLRGIEALSEISGLFAICMSNGRFLHLARDRFGIKPLYYSRINDGLIAFASEMKALLAVKGVDRSLDSDVIASFRVLGYNVFPGKTPFKGIRAVEPGTCLTFRSNKQHNVQRFGCVLDNCLTPAKQAFDSLAITHRVQELLQKSVHRNYAHDSTPKAIFLSGGLDSAYLLSLAKETGEIHPFTLWDGQNDEDLADALALCRELGCSPSVITASSEELDRAIVHYAWHFEHPIGGAGFDLFGGVAFHILAKHIAGQHRVAFSGEGADELFMGYHPYHGDPTLLQNSLLAETSLVGCQALSDRLHDLGVFEAGTVLDRAMRNLALSAGLAEYHLPSVDRSGMAFGLEIRLPYLDEDLTAFVNSLPFSALIDRNENWTKLPLRTLFKRRLPATGTRCAVRRKRAMTYALAALADNLKSRMHTVSPTLSLRELFWRLFFYLHTGQLHTIPDVAFSDLLPELTAIEVPLCKSSS